ncbi:Protein FAM151B, partial [Frankliniella fusca]
QSSRCLPAGNTPPEASRPSVPFRLEQLRVRSRPSRSRQQSANAAAPREHHASRNTPSPTPTMARLSPWTLAQARAPAVLVVAALLSLSGLHHAASQTTGEAVGTSTAMPASHAPAVAEQAAPAAAPKEVDPQDVAGFFNIKGDLTKITWAHAVNSKALLAQSLNDSGIMMLEADVVLGTTPESPNQVPVMGHPPETTSDLSLEEFLRSVVTHNKVNNETKKGVKLDFKSINVYEKAIDSLKQTFGAVPAFPVWLNADILPGPVRATAVPVDAARFLAKAKAQYPFLLLSLGWTTRWGQGLDGETVPESLARYDNTSVQSMLTALDEAGVTQPITYAVRAAFVAHSLDELTMLLNETRQEPGKRATLTVWSSDATDVVDVDQLRKNILAIGKDRVYLDVGEDLAKRLDLASSALSTCASAATTLLACAACALALLRAL